MSIVRRFCSGKRRLLLGRRSPVLQSQGEALGYRISPLRGFASTLGNSTAIVRRPTGWLIGPRRRHCETGIRRGRMGSQGKLGVSGSAPPGWCESMASTPSDSWFYIAGERPIGPLSADKLRSAASAGVVCPETMVRKAGWSHWCQAGQVGELFPSRLALPPQWSAPPVSAAPRPTRRSVAPPPLPVPKHGGIRQPSGRGRSARADAQSEEEAVPADRHLHGRRGSAGGLRRAGGRSTGNSAESTDSGGAYRGPGPEKVRGAALPREKPKGQEQGDTDLRIPIMPPDPVVETGYDRTAFEVAASAPTPRGRLDRARFRQMETVGNQAGQPLLRRGVRAARLPGRHRHAAHAEGGASFLATRTPEQAPQLIDTLLERDEFAEYWAMKWGDLLRIKAEFPINLWPNAAQAYHRWVHASHRAEQLPYDQFARELLTSSGSNFRVPAGQLLPRRAEQGHRQRMAQAVALTFMGARAEKWPHGAAGRHGGVLFAGGLQAYRRVERRDRLLRSRRRQSRRQGAGRRFSRIGQAGRLPDRHRAGSPRRDRVRCLPTGCSRRGTRGSPATSSTASGIGCWGAASCRNQTTSGPIIRPPIPNCWPIWSTSWWPAHYDLKHIYRLILNSQVYQLSSSAGSQPPRPEAAAQFAWYPVRRLDAEVLIDAVCQITGTTEEYASVIPEPFTFMPEDQRSIALPDGSITSAFLAICSAARRATPAWHRAQ